MAALDLATGTDESLLFDWVDGASGVPASSGRVLIEAADAAEMGAALARHVAGAAGTAIEARGQFSLALSGGSMPKVLGALADLAAATPTAAAPDAEGGGGGVAATATWCEFERWQVFFSDERCVPLDHEDSNFRACVETLLARVPIPRANVHTLDAALLTERAAAGAAATPEDDAAAAATAVAYEANLVAALCGGVGGGDGGVGGLPPAIDLVLLGLGPDGHTASLFPGHALLDGAGGRLVAHLSDSPKPPSCRITLTYTALAAARACAFVAGGAGKAEVLTQIFEAARGDDGAEGGARLLRLRGFDASASEPAPLPAARVRPRAGDGRLLWFVDRAAMAAVHAAAAAAASDEPP